MAKPYKSPSYLTRNSAGTFVFQVRIPLSIKRQNDRLKPLLRCSLNSKEYAEALRRSRYKWLMFDMAVQQYADPNQFEFQIQEITAGAECGTFGLPSVSNNQTEFMHGSSENRELELSAEPVKSIVDDFMAHKRNTGARAASLKWYSQKVYQFLNIATALNDGSTPTTKSLTSNLMRQYASVMHRYPKHANTRTQTKDLTEAQRVDFVLKNDRDSLSAMGVGHAASHFAISRSTS